MTIRNDEYWKRRAEQLEKALTRSNQKTYKELEQIFDAAIKDVERAIQRWYHRYLINNDDISLAEAKRRLSKRDLEEFKWDVQEYIRKGRENGITADFEKQLENASAAAPAPILLLTILLIFFIMYFFFDCFHTLLSKAYFFYI